MIKPASTVILLPTSSPVSQAQLVLSPTAAGILSPTIPISPSSTQTPTNTPSQQPTASTTPLPSATHTNTPTSTHTPTPTISFTPTITPTSTYSLPRYTASMQANCRYGPSTAYLYAWGMYTGDASTVWGRNASGTWLWVQPDAIHYQCWVAASVVEVVGDVMALRIAPVRLPHSTLYGPPPWVKAVRNGNQVTVTWGRVAMTEDDNRGYMIEANVCRNGYLVWMAVATYQTKYTFTDDINCKEKSNGLLYTVEKHGYTDPIKIPWPK